jgi:hypothetical protein
VNVGEHSERRKAHEGTITKLRVELDGIEARIAEQTEKAADLGRKAARLAPDAVGGSEKALSEQNRLLTEKSKAFLQASNLETVAAPIRSQLADAESRLSNFILADQLELVAAETPKLSEMAKKLSTALIPLARDFGELKKQIISVAATALPLVGDRETVSRLENLLPQSFDRAVRAGLHKIFHAQGIALFDALKYGGEDFETVMGRTLGDLQCAIDSKLHTTSGVAVAGRAFYVARTNIAGLFGMTVKVGEEISLPVPVDDPAVLGLIAQGALEKITDEKRGAAL